jgi:hypothetical protein
MVIVPWGSILRIRQLPLSATSRPPSPITEVPRGALSSATVAGPPSPPSPLPPGAGDPRHDPRLLPGGVEPPAPAGAEVQRPLLDQQIAELARDTPSLDRPLRVAVTTHALKPSP